MLTYLNEYGKRAEVTNDYDIKKWYEVDKKMDELDEETFNKYYEIIGDYVWDGGVANANRARAIAKKLGFTLLDISNYYCIEEW